MSGAAQPPQDDEERALVAVLVAAMESRGMTQAELARRSGISAPQLNEFVKGKKLMRWWQVVALCRALGLTPQEAISRAEKAGEL